MSITIRHSALLFLSGDVHLHLKVIGAWKETATAKYIKVNGEWKAIASAQIKVNGAWKTI